MLLDEEMDHGPILMSQEIKNRESRYVYNIERKAGRYRSEVVTEGYATMDKRTNTATRTRPQQATYSKMIRKEGGVIDWTRLRKK